MNTQTITKQDIGLALIRAMIGIVFIFHGGQKLFGLWGGYGIQGTAQFMASINIPLPTLSAVMAGTAEFFGGIALIIGVLFRFSSASLVFTMLVAAFAVHGGAFSAQNNGLEYPLTLAIVALGLVFTGAGRLTVLSLLPEKQLEPVAQPVDA